MLARAPVFILALAAAVVASPLGKRMVMPSPGAYRCPATDSAGTPLSDLRMSDPTTTKCFYGVSSDGTPIDYCTYNTQTGDKLGDNDGGRCLATADHAS